MSREIPWLVHFGKDEQAFVQRALDWVTRAIRRQQMLTTPFLNPREQWILQSLVNQEPDLALWADGGYPQAERCRVILYPKNWGEVQFDEQICCFRLQSSSGKPLKHRDVLGSLVGMGVKREKIGDLLPHRSGCDMIVAIEMSDYLLSHCQKVGNEPVLISPIAREALRIERPKIVVRQVVVSSLRLDKVVAAGFRVARNKANQLIKLGKCQVNWHVVDQPDYFLKEGDLISMRGYGRMELQKIVGTTKRGNSIVQLSTSV